MWNSSERSLYGIGKSAQSADRFIGGGTNVTFELGNETFYRLIKPHHKIVNMNCG